MSKALVLMTISNFSGFFSRNHFLEMSFTFQWEEFVCQLGRLHFQMWWGEGMGFDWYSKKNHKIMGRQGRGAVLAQLFHYGKPYLLSLKRGIKQCSFSMWVFLSLDTHESQGSRGRRRRPTLNLESWNSWLFSKK